MFGYKTMFSRIRKGRTNLQLKDIHTAYHLSYIYAKMGGSTLTIQVQHVKMATESLVSGKCM